MDVPSNFSVSFKFNFLGSKDPTPAAIIMFGVKNFLLALVLITQFSLS